MNAQHIYVTSIHAAVLSPCSASSPHRTPRQRVLTGCEQTENTRNAKGGNTQHAVVAAQKTGDISLTTHSRRGQLHLLVSHRKETSTKITRRKCLHTYTTRQKHPSNPHAKKKHHSNTKNTLYTNFHSARPKAKAARTATTQRQQSRPHFSSARPSLAQLVRSHCILSHQPIRSHSNTVIISDLPPGRVFFFFVNAHPKGG